MWNVGVSLISNMTIYADTITNIFVTWKLETLHQGDCDYCQCHRSKKINANIWWLYLMNMHGNLRLGLLFYCLTIVPMKCNYFIHYLLCFLLQRCSTSLTLGMYNKKNLGFL